VNIYRIPISKQHQMQCGRILDNLARAVGHLPIHFRPCGTEIENSCRNVRRDSMKAIAQLENDGLGEDEARNFEESVQESTNDAVKQIEGLLKSKQDELTKV